MLHNDDNGKRQMRFLAELRARARHAIGPVLGISAIVYVAYHAVQGQRGLIAYWQLANQVVQARVNLAHIADERAVMENRVRLLHPQNLDPDMVEERARIMLGYGYPDERILLNE
jgi:cell division protein FtsB